MSRALKTPKNAVSHGLYSRDLLLSWENEQDFNDLHQSLRDELDPDGPAEEAAVLDYAGLLWKKQRLAIGLQLLYRAHPDAAALSAAGKEGGWDGIANYVQAPAGSGDRMCVSMRAFAKLHVEAGSNIVKAISVEARRIESPASAGTDDKRQSANRTETLERLNKLASHLGSLGDRIVSALEFVENYDLEQSVVARAYRPELLEKELRIMGLFDKQCEKALTRLAQLKDFKRLYRKQEVKVIAPRPAKSKEDA